ncbi:tRNA (adenosine(37)-N6)-threonylcarbamoyltransferase complex ATPase subunit type 1 TsaE [Synergistales bacterium]|nr:tRNA (adenosine(37)-N6)-threonylcarbamoyltransferase complex ATPase subunit type 1 TsaE [Synergistales bacterium]
MGEEISRASTCSVRSNSEEETLCLGRKFGAGLTPGVTALLFGDLGAGKTVFARGIGDALGVARVHSPSFTLINEYKGEKFRLVHADLYRLDDADDLGLEEYLDDDAALLVEWPERWRNQPMDDTIKISFETIEDEPDKRIIHFSALGERALNTLKYLKKDLL